MNPAASIHQTPRHLPKSRYLLAIAILFVSVWAGAALMGRLRAENLRHQAGAMLSQNHLGLAVELLRRAVDRVPRDPGFRKSLAEAYHRMGQPDDFGPQNRMGLKKAKAVYAAALQLNPLDAEAALGMALAESRLQQIHRAMFPGERAILYDARPFFESALVLRPNGIPLHFALIRHLDRVDDRRGLMSAVERLCRIHPAAKDELRKSRYWRPAVRSAAQRGLMAAVAEGTDLQTAHFALSAIAAEEGRWGKAAAEYEKALAFRLEDPIGAQHRKLGALCLRAGRIDRAETLFLKGLAVSRDREKDLAAIYEVYARTANAIVFRRLYEKVQQRFSLPPRTGIVMARAHLNDGDTASARRLLEGINAVEPLAEAWLWLFRVAEAEKDTDQMELALQRATVLDPNNSEYRQRLIGLLKGQGKYRTAEAQVDRLIKNQSRPSASLLVQRADLRYQQGNFAGAAEDWLAAARLAPARVDFLARAGEALVKAGDWRGARRAYQKAAKRSPKNGRYQEQLRRLDQGARR